MPQAAPIIKGVMCIAKMSARFQIALFLIIHCGFVFAAEESESIKIIESDLQDVIADAENGDPIAQMNLGHEYFRGVNLPLNYTLAREWYEKSLENGNDRVGGMLFQIYEQGLGVEVSIERAQEYLKIGASSGDFAAMCFLSNFLKTGQRGFDIDLVEANEWDKKLLEYDFDCAPFLQL